MFTIEIRLGDRLVYIGYSEDDSIFNDIIKMWKSCFTNADINIYKE